MTHPFSSAEGSRRFWRQVSVVAADGGLGVMLDARWVRSPGGRRLALPTHALAELIAEEWAAQGEVLEMARMQATRLAFTTVDHAEAARAELAREVARVAAADLLCYFAEAPRALVERQRQRWGAVLDWAEAELGLAFARVTGVMHTPQPEATLARIEALAGGLDDFALAGLAFGAGLFGSAVLALAARDGWLDGEAAFELSRLDEVFQEEQWGVDAEAAARTADMRAQAIMLGRWFAALG